ncbi:MAG: SGNH/GDSL hydrolase family protein [Phycisphaerae bacterium]
MKAYWYTIIVALAIMAVALPAMAAKRKFFLKSGDRVCFYGDSITEQRFYPTDVETYVLTRFPKLRVRFIDSGVGGDRVTGGWAGPINLRLRRDVFPFKPTVVTIMLGMNDAGYQPFNPTLFSIYRKGYEHIINSLQRHLPGVRIVLLETSPYDDVTHKPKFPGGYNSVLIHYNRFVDHLAKLYHLLCVNFNKPLVKVLKLAWRINPKLARQIIPGRIHPSVAGQLVMAQALLKAWGAPPIVSTVTINGATASLIRAANTQVGNLKRQQGGLTWTQRDGSLPMPVIGLHENWPLFPSWNIFLPPQPNPKFTNPVAALVNKFSGFTHQLDREMLTVKGLPASRYKLLIDGQLIADFGSKDLAGGINLSHYFTPMLQQAYRVSNIVWEQTQIRFVAWHGVQTTMQDFNFNWSPPTLNLPVTTENDAAVARAVSEVVRTMNGLQDAVIAREYVANQPQLHRYALVPIGE